jgi:hypothetical protein
MSGRVGSCQTDMDGGLERAVAQQFAKSGIGGSCHHRADGILRGPIAPPSSGPWTGSPGLAWTLWQEGRWMGVRTGTANRTAPAWAPGPFRSREEMAPG